jgi:S1-C subfamily serine protease
MLGFRGVAVVGVVQHALAAEHIKPGDLIVAVNNSRISGANEFFLHLAASAAVQDTSLHLVREGQVLRINLPAIPRRQ